MVRMFGWALPLAPTQKILKHSIKIANREKDGLIAWDVSWHGMFKDSICTPADDICVRLKLDGEDYSIVHAAHLYLKYVNSSTVCSTELDSLIKARAGDKLR